jgi:hypothetical protein
MQVLGPTDRETTGEEFDLTSRELVALRARERKLMAAEQVPATHELRDGLGLDFTHNREAQDTLAKVRGIVEEWEHPSRGTMCLTSSEAMGRIHNVVKP